MAGNDEIGNLEIALSANPEGVQRGAKAAADAMNQAADASEAAAARIAKAMGSSREEARAFFAEQKALGSSLSGYKTAEAINESADALKEATVQTNIAAAANHRLVTSNESVTQSYAANQKAQNDTRDKLNKDFQRKQKEVNQAYVQDQADTQRKVTKEIESAHRERSATQSSIAKQEADYAFAAETLKQQAQSAAEKQGEVLASDINTKRLTRAEASAKKRMEIEKAYAQDAQKNQVTIATQESVMWKQREKQQTQSSSAMSNQAKSQAKSTLAVQKQAEKEGEAIVTEANSKRMKAFSTTADRLAKDVVNTSKASSKAADEAGKLQAKLAKDASKFSTEAALGWKVAARTIGAEVGNLIPGMGTLGREMGYVASTSTGMGLALGGVTGPLLAVGAALVAIVGVGAGAAYALYSLATGAADFGEKLFTMRAESGLTINNILALTAVAPAAGSNIEKLNQSLKMMQRRTIEAAEGGTSPLSKYLRQLNLDTEDNNKALSQFISYLSQFPAGAKRTTEAIRIAGRSGEEWATITDIMGGSLKNFTADMEKMGITLGEDGVEKSRKFIVQQKLMGLQFDLLKFKIGEAAFPVVQEWFTGISDWMSKHQNEIVGWGQDFVSALKRITGEFRASGIIDNLKDTVTWVNENKDAIIALISTAGDLFTIISKILDITSKPAQWVIHIAADIVGEGAKILQKVIGQVSKDFTGPSAYSGLKTVPLTGRSYDEEFNPFPKLTGPPPSDVQPEGEFGLPGSGNKGVEKIVKRSATWPGKKTGGHKGEDPARTATRLAEIALKVTLDNLKAEEDGLDFSLRRRTSSLEKFTSDSIALEIKRHEATLGARSHMEGGKEVKGTGLLGELDEAENIRKPGARAVKVAEINAKINEERLSSTKKVRDEIQKLQEDWLERDRIFEQTRLAIAETVGRQQVSRAKSFATAGLITEEDAAKKELEITTRLYVQRGTMLQSDMNRAGDNFTEQARIRGEMGKLETQYSADVEDAQRRIKDAREKDVEGLLDQERVIDQIMGSRRDLIRETSQLELDTLGITGVFSRNLIMARAKLEKEAEEDRVKRAVAELEREKRRLTALTEAGLIHADRAKEQATAIDKEIEAIHGASNARIEKINAQAAQDVLDHWKNASQDLADLIMSGFKGGFKGIVDSAKQILDQLTKELLSSAFLRLLQPGSKQQPSNTGGLVGVIFNKLLGIKDVTPKESKALVDNTDVTTKNTAALDALTLTLGGTPSGGGGTGIGTIGHELLHLFGVGGAKSKSEDENNKGSSSLALTNSLEAKAAGMVYLNTAQATITAGSVTLTQGSGVMSGPSGALQSIFGFTLGGLLQGPGTGKSDSIMGVNEVGKPIARVSNGEFVVKESSTKKLLPYLEYMNRTGNLPALAGGGLLSGLFGGIGDFFGGLSQHKKSKTLTTADIRRQEEEKQRVNDLLWDQLGLKRHDLPLEQLSVKHTRELPPLKPIGAMSARHPGYVERLKEWVKPYVPGLTSIDTPMGIKTDVLRGPLRNMTLGIFGDQRQISAEELLANPEALADQAKSEKAGIALSMLLRAPKIGAVGFLPYTVASKILQLHGAGTKVGLGQNIITTGLTFGGVEVARQGVDNIRHGTPFNMASAAISAGVGGTMSGLQGLNAGLLRTIGAYVTPQAILDTVRGASPWDIGESAATNALFGVQSGIGGSRVSRTQVQGSKFDSRQFAFGEAGSLKLAENPQELANEQLKLQLDRFGILEMIKSDQFLSPQDKVLAAHSKFTKADAYLQEQLKARNLENIAAKQNLNWREMRKWDKYRYNPEVKEQMRVRDEALRALVQPLRDMGHYAIVNDNNYEPGFHSGGREELDALVARSPILPSAIAPFSHTFPESTPRDWLEVEREKAQAKVLEVETGQEFVTQTLQDIVDIRAAKNAYEVADEASYKKFGSAVMGSLSQTMANRAYEGRERLRQNYLDSISGQLGRLSKNENRFGLPYGAVTTRSVPDPLDSKKWATKYDISNHGLVALETWAMTTPVPGAHSATEAGMALMNQALEANKQINPNTYYLSRRALEYREIARQNKQRPGLFDRFKAAGQALFGSESGSLSLSNLAQDLELLKRIDKSAIQGKEFHGTAKVFDEFKASRHRTDPSGVRAIFTTPELDQAEYYTHSKSWIFGGPGRKDRPNIRPVYLDVEKAFDVEKTYGPVEIKKLADSLRALDLKKIGYQIRSDQGERSNYNGEGVHGLTISQSRAKELERLDDLVQKGTSQTGHELFQGKLLGKYQYADITTRTLQGAGYQALVDKELRETAVFDPQRIIPAVDVEAARKRVMELRGGFFSNETGSLSLPSDDLFRSPTAPRDRGVHNGKNFWIGTVNTLDGQIENTYTRAQAEAVGSHHEQYMSPADVDGINSGERAMFWIDKDGQVQSEWRNGGMQATLKALVEKQLGFFSDETGSLSTPKRGVKLVKGGIKPGEVIPPSPTLGTSLKDWVKQSQDAIAAQKASERAQFEKTTGPIKNFFGSERGALKLPINIGPKKSDKELEKSKAELEASYRRRGIDFIEIGKDYGLKDLGLTGLPSDPQDEYDAWVRAGKPVTSSGWGKPHSYKSLFEGYKKAEPDWSDSEIDDFLRKIAPELFPDLRIQELGDIDSPPKFGLGGVIGNIFDFFKNLFGDKDKDFFKGFGSLQDVLRPGAFNNDGLHRTMDQMLGQGDFKRRATGGLLHGPGSGTSDSILAVNNAGIPTARVSNGEFVVREAVTKKMLPILRFINQHGELPALQEGGTVPQAGKPVSGIIGADDAAVAATASGLTTGTSRVQETLAANSNVTVDNTNSIRDLTAKLNEGSGLGGAHTGTTREKVNWVRGHISSLITGGLSGLQLAKSVYNGMTASASPESHLGIDPHVSLDPSNPSHEMDAMFPGLKNGGTAYAGELYHVNENNMEFFRPRLTGEVIPLSSGKEVGAPPTEGRGEVRTIVAFGDRAIGEAVEAHGVSSRGKRAKVISAKYGRKIGKVTLE